jgi:hypothetical protein
MNKDFNPFALNSYFGSDYFCDRKNEINTLLTNIKNGNSTTIISQRRMGKTLLIQHLFNIMPSKYIGIDIDIFATTNRREFLNKLTTAIASKVPEKSSFGKKVWKFIKSLQPNISFDPLTGSPQININITTPSDNNYIESIFNFLENQPQKIVIAIDEFQQILNYPENNTDIWLRTFIQKLNNVIFIFSGSSTHLMSDLFSNPAKPFFRSTKFIFLKKIPAEEYIPFIINHFSKGKKKISEEIITEILEWTHGHTYYVQALCSKIYDMPEKVITQNLWKKAAAELLSDEESIFMKFRDLLPLKQWQLLNAIAIESKVYQPTSIDFISKYRLGSSAGIIRALNALIEKDMIYAGNDDKNKKFYAVNDVFFEKWAQWRNPL